MHACEGSRRRAEQVHQPFCLLEPRAGQFWPRLTSLRCCGDHLRFVHDFRSTSVDPRLSSRSAIGGQRSASTTRQERLHLSASLAKPLYFKSRLVSGVVSRIVTVAYKTVEDHDLIEMSEVVRRRREISRCSRFLSQSCHEISAPYGENLSRVDSNQQLRIRIIPGGS